MLGLQRSLLSHSHAGTSLHIPVQAAPQLLVLAQRSPGSCPCPLWHRGAAQQFLVKPQAGELVPDLALWGMKSVKHNFPMHLLISKHFA